MEEAGELAQVIGKFRGMSGESSVLEENKCAQAIAEELLDVAQTSVTMMFVLEEEYGIDINKELDRHYEKLLRKGYIKE